MELTILTDDNVVQGKNLLAEHGLCFYIETAGKKILFDLGYSDVFLKNAFKLGIDLLDLDYIVLSHGHNDHTWGLSSYLPLYQYASGNGKPIKKPAILAHPDTFLEKYEEGVGEIGCLVSVEKLKKIFDIKLSKEPFYITNRLVFLGEIPRINNFEAKEPIKKVLKNGKYEDDYVMEDSAMVYKSDKGLSVITGCSHAGICNIIEYAKNICSESKFKAVIGGFHLINPPNEKMSKITDYLLKQNIEELYPSHCTNFYAKVELAKKLNVKEAGVGIILSL